uniref:DNA-directed RNA polymerase subunit n=1 Tax=Chloropicon maureeniae TaxID=1461542 RepID=A0A4D6C3I3_9CHLO|nr:beta' subunit of RNA polymerase [Chloropicon maureeniae]QBX98214.1 beta' subunit of RNA polymerase [Chloropicon maureeniae]
MINFGHTSIRFASPEMIRFWAQRKFPNGKIIGEVTNPETLQYRTQKPVPGGLFCEAIFGPTVENDCWCGFLGKMERRGKSKSFKYCPKCFVEKKNPRIRRYRLGYIELKTPVVHPWLLKSVPNYLSLLLNLKRKELLDFAYCHQTIKIVSTETNSFTSFGYALNHETFSVHQQFKRLNPNRFELGLVASFGIRDFDKIPNIKGVPHSNGPIKLKSNIQPTKLCTGGEAIEYLLRQINLERELQLLLKSISEVQKELSVVPIVKNHFKQPPKSFSRFYTKLKKDVRRLKVINALSEGSVEPDWFILKAIPVLPPELRPILRLPNGVFAVSDLNTLYRKILIRNNRYQTFVQLGLWGAVLMEKRLLQEAVDQLIETKRTGSSFNQKRVLKSLSDTLRGKQGRFRQYLLGKRIDYSGRSVIVVGPELRLNQCGLPREMVLELFQPFLVARLIGRSNLARSVRQAKTFLQNPPTRLWPLIQSCIAEHPILLNRAPTLHRLGIQAFEPKVVSGRAILLHPLVCPAFNADFDGDQMAVHIPLSIESICEARILMLATHNLLSPATGQPVTLPSQDMVLGCYFLTADAQIYQKGFYQTFEEILQAYEQNLLGLHTWVWMRWDEPFTAWINEECPLEIRIHPKGFRVEIYKSSIRFYEKSGLLTSQYIKTTPGRVLWNQAIYDVFQSTF